MPPSLRIGRHPSPTPLTHQGFLVLFRDPGLRLAVATFLAFSSILLHTTTTPYTDSATNALALISHLLVFSTFFVGQQISSGVVPNDSLEVIIVLLTRMRAFQCYAVRPQPTLTPT